MKTSIVRFSISSFFVSFVTLWFKVSSLDGTVIYLRRMWQSPHLSLLSMNLREKTSMYLYQVLVLIIKVLFSLVLDGVVC